MRLRRTAPQPGEPGEQPARKHPVDEVLPAHRLAVLGLQHLFIMYAGAVAVPLIVGGALKLPSTTIGLLVSADLLVSGIATIIQSAGISKIFGVRLPVVAGATFTVLAPMIVIAEKYGLQAVYGAMLVSGVFGLIIAKPFSMLIRFFPPLVSGTVICVIGLSLIGADVGLIAGENPAERFPSGFQVIFGSSITSTVIVVFVLNLVFNHWSWRQPKADDAIDEALAYGAVAVDVPDGGVNPHGGDVNPHGGGQPTG
jgi:xanthine/uracil permease